MPDAVALIHVVVPAHDEAELLPACLAALSDAISHLRAHRPSVVARLTVVLDACADASAALCHDHGVDTVEIPAANVGVARATGTDRARHLARGDGVHPAHTWIACTDADSSVPTDWLVDQVDVAATGADVVLGRVEPDGTAAAEVLARWHHLHDDGRVGVHGAHLGFRLSAYDAVGGWSDLAHGEDLDLVKRLLASGARYGAATRLVLTSSRLEGRTKDGFATYLTDLEGAITAQTARGAVSPSPTGR